MWIDIDPNWIIKTNLLKNRSTHCSFNTREWCCRTFSWLSTWRSNFNKNWCNGNIIEMSVVYHVHQTWDCQFWIHITMRFAKSLFEICKITNSRRWRTVRGCLIYFRNFYCYKFDERCTFYFLPESKINEGGISLFAFIW